MKKNIIALLLVLAVVSFGVFAVDSVGFDVKTSVAAVNAMRLTAAEFEGETEAALGAATEMSLTDGAIVITSDNLTTNTIGYISTISNSRAGFKVTMEASAMESEVDSQATSYINYKVTADSETYNTAVSSAAVTVIDRLTTKPTTLVWDSKALSIEVDATEFAAAVEGSYVGTVTFTWTVS